MSKAGQYYDNIVKPVMSNTVSGEKIIITINPYGTKLWTVLNNGEFVTDVLWKVKIW